MAEIWRVKGTVGGPSGTVLPPKPLILGGSKKFRHSEIGQKNASPNIKLEVSRTPGAKVRFQGSQGAHPPNFIFLTPIAP